MFFGMPALLLAFEISLLIIIFLESPSTSKIQLFLFWSVSALWGLLDP